MKVKVKNLVAAMLPGSPVVIVKDSFGEEPMVLLFTHSLYFNGELTVPKSYLKQEVSYFENRDNGGYVIHVT